MKNLLQQVYDELGPGYSERVYHNALEVLLREHGIPYETERIIPIVFRGHTIGNMRADLIVNKQTIVELKSVKSLTDAYRTQVQCYLRLLGLQQGLLVNFGSSDGLSMELIVEKSLQSPSDPVPTSLDPSVPPPWLQ